MPLSIVTLVLVVLARADVRRALALWLRTEPNTNARHPAGARG